MAVLSTFSEGETVEMSVMAARICAGFPSDDAGRLSSCFLQSYPQTAK
ncbi:hypothetical protein ABK905_26520 [Acerihabitans sp. KWT182]|uniref:Uncharacterized protein n=1 Tax=Acerihabitans sp. KWT182 TaxID=3157919 RepID=A0AAU7QG54_9GAMM